MLIRRLDPSRDFLSFLLFLSVAYCLLLVLSLLVTYNLAMRSSWLLFALFSNSAVSSTLPRQLQWSSKTYGPDGPWHAVSIDLGSDKQLLDLYPGNTWHSNILGSSICANVSTCYAQQAGLYDSSTSTSVLTYTTIDQVEQIDWTSGAMPLTGTHSVQFDTATVLAPNLVSSAIVPNHTKWLLYTPQWNKLSPGSWNPCFRR
jgi:hypothetical protein